MPTPSQRFVGRLKEISGLIPEAEVCRRAGIKSRSQLAAARSRGSALNWDHVAAMTEVLVAAGFSREWLLWGEGPKMSGAVVRLGPGVESVEIPPSSGSSGKVRKKRVSSTPNDAERPSKERHGGKRPGPVRRVNDR